MGKVQCTHFILSSTFFNVFFLVDEKKNIFFITNSLISNVSKCNFLYEHGNDYDMIKLL